MSHICVFFLFFSCVNLEQMFLCPFSSPNLPVMLCNISQSLPNCTFRANMWLRLRNVNRESAHELRRLDGDQCKKASEPLRQAVLILRISNAVCSIYCLIAQIALTSWDARISIVGAFEQFGAFIALLNDSKKHFSHDYHEAKTIATSCAYGTNPKGKTTKG